MTEEEIHRMVDETVEKTVERTLKSLGITTDNPFEMQKDMQHLRAWREAVATVKKQTMLTAVGIIITGIVGLIWMAVKNPQ